MSTSADPVPADPVLCQQTAGGTDGADDLRLAAAAGFQRVSLHDSRLAGDDADGWARRLADAGLTAARARAAASAVVAPHPPRPRSGARTPEQVRANVAAGQWTPTEQQLAELGTVLDGAAAG